MKLEGANPAPRVSGLGELPGRSNYFIGNDPKKWRTNVRNYSKVRYQGVYPGVDLVYYGHQRQLEYDFVVTPGADPRAIRLDIQAVGAVREAPRAHRPAVQSLLRDSEPFRGLRATGRGAPLRISAQGDLIVKVGGGEIRFHKPLVYQPATQKKSSVVGSQWSVARTNAQRTQVAFVEGNQKAKVQDQPAMDYGLRTPDASVGGNQESKVKSQTSRVEDPQTPDSGLRTVLDGRYVLRASKFESRNSRFEIGEPEIQNPKSKVEVGFEITGYDPRKPLVIDPVLSYSTYLGGSSQDSGFGIVVDSNGSAYVTGETSSTDFPTMGAYQGDNAGASNAFVTKFDPTGTTLVYSTYLGGSSADRGTSIAVDTGGNAYVTGRTNSVDFPFVNAFQDQLFGDFDAFVVKLSGDGSALLYSSYLGGSGNDAGFGIAVDNSGNVYVTGGVGVGSQDDFPTTSGAFQRVFGGGINDAFVTKFDPTMSGSASLVYSTFLGGGDVERGNSIAVDSAGNAYVTGRTRSNDFPTVNPLQPALQGFENAFVAKLDPMGSMLLYSTFLGGSGLDQGYGIAVDSAGNAYVTGQTFSTDFPTVNALQTDSGGDSDAFMAKIDSTGSCLLYSTYLGGSGVDLGSGIAVDTSGIAYVTGRTSSSTDFPTSPDAIQATFGGGFNDAFIAKIDASQSGAASLVYSSYLGGSDDENIPATGSGGNPSGAIAVDGPGNAYVTGNSSSANFPSMNPYQATYGGDPSDAFVTKIAFSGTAPDFVGAATPASQTIAAGSSTTYTVTVSPTGGFTGEVTLSVDGLPAGASATFDPPVITITDSCPQSSTMTVTTDVATPLGTYSLTVTGASGSLQHMASVLLVVTDPASATQRQR